MTNTAEFVGRETQREAVPPGGEAHFSRLQTSLAALPDCVELAPRGAGAIALMLPCPQDRDCPSGGLASRIFDCGEGCGFRGCAACMEIHEAEPHSGDFATMTEMGRNMGVAW